MHRFIPAWLATVTSPGRMAEEPVRHHPRTAGVSKVGPGRSARVVLDLLSVHFFLRFGTRPGHFFGGIGLVVSLIGFAMLGYLTLLKMLGQSIGSRPLLFLGFFLVMAGVQLLTTGVVAELLMRVYYDVGRARPYRLREPDAVRDELPQEAGWHD
jgi:hypothetical protein